MYFLMSWKHGFEKTLNFAKRWSIGLSILTRLTGQFLLVEKPCPRGKNTLKLSPPLIPHYEPTEIQFSLPCILLPIGYKRLRLQLHRQSGRRDRRRYPRSPAQPTPRTYPLERH